MKLRIAITMLLLCLWTPATALAHTRHHHAQLAAGQALLATFNPTTPALSSADSVCPAGVPVQTITVVNQANVRPFALAKVERATTDQSMQLHAAWGAPCVEFGPGGWVLTLTNNGGIHNSDGSTSYTTSGRHCGALGTSRWTCYSAQPTLSVETAGLSYTVWARAFTHEVGETLADPTDGVTWAHGLVEIDDPVESLTYPLDGVPVSDFVLPSYFSGSAGPWDQMDVLTGPIAAL